MALADAMKAAKKIALLGLVSDLDPLHSNKMPKRLKSVLALPDFSSGEAAVHDQPVLHDHSAHEDVTAQVCS